MSEGEFEVTDNNVKSVFRKIFEVLRCLWGKGQSVGGLAEIWQTRLWTLSHLIGLPGVYWPADAIRKSHAITHLMNINERFCIKSSNRTPSIVNRRAFDLFKTSPYVLSVSSNCLR